MSRALLDYVESLKKGPEPPSFDPELDEVDEKKTSELRYPAYVLLTISSWTSRTSSVQQIGYAIELDTQHNRAGHTAEQSLACRELDDLSSGAIRTATMQPGRGGRSPTDGDLVSRCLCACLWLALLRPALQDCPCHTHATHVHFAETQTRA